MMIPRDRFLAALDLERPEEVPYYESEIEKVIAEKLFGEKNPDQRRLSILFHRDHVPSFCFAPSFFVSEKTSQSGERKFFSRGLIKSREDLEGRELISPNDESIYAEVRKEVARKGDLAVNALIGVGLDEAVLSMGLENFCYAMYDDPDLVCALIDRFVDWCCIVVDNLMEIGVDFMWAGTDIAYKSGPMFDPEIFRTLFLPRIRRVTDRITVPWIFHSDGNIIPYMNDLLTLGMNAIHPIEPDAMDIVEFKEAYGNRVCVVGNISVDLLSQGTPEQVREEVRWRMKKLGSQGGYIISSGNSIPGYVDPHNYWAMVEAIEEYRKI